MSQEASVTNQVSVASIGQVVASEVDFSRKHYLGLNLLDLLVFNPLTVVGALKCPHIVACFKKSLQLYLH